MEQFDFATLWGIGLTSGVAIACTDPEELERLVAGVKQMFPNLEVKQTNALPTTDKKRDYPTYNYFLKSLANRDSDVGWWIIRELCHSGWEPLGAVNFVFTPPGNQSSTASNLIHQFRRRSGG